MSRSSATAGHVLLVLGIARIAASGSVEIRLQDTGAPASVVSFGLPLPAGALESAAGAKVFLAGKRDALPNVRFSPLVSHFDATASRRGIASLLVQVPRAAIGESKALRVEWGETVSTAPPSAGTIPYASVRRESAESVDVVDYAIEKRGNEFRLVESAPRPRVLFQAWEPPTLALVPDGYLAASGIFGALLDKSQVLSDPRLAGLRFLSENLALFTLSALYEDGYHPSAYPGEEGKPATAAVVDPTQVTEAWLYDRCATLLLAYAHTGDIRFYRHGSRACSFYASRIDPQGFFALKTDGKGPAMDAKHSHVRGLYFYYALTGDEMALDAGRRVANMWLNDASFVRSYRQGRARGPENLWTERLLAHSLEALVYGYLLTGQADLLSAARELFESAWGHLTAPDPERLRTITGHALAPQDCLVHAAVQHEGEPRGEPFCSPWMSALLVDPLLRYQALTGDRRVDEVFVRLGRYLRDTATRYFIRNPLGDFFLKPVQCYDARQGSSARRLVPLYGAARRLDGSRYDVSGWHDINHCADATTLTAAALRALQRTGGFDKPGPAPFRTEGESLLALHNELAHCALLTFGVYSQAKVRDPRRWTSQYLARSEGKPNWILGQKIGFPSYPTDPLRKLSWWFNGSLLQFKLVQEAGVSFEKLSLGAVQPAQCP